MTPEDLSFIKIKYGNIKDPDFVSRLPVEVIDRIIKQDVLEDNMDIYIFSESMRRLMVRTYIKCNINRIEETINKEVIAYHMHHQGL